MTDGESGNEPAEHPLEGHATVSISAGAASLFTESRTEGEHRIALVEIEMRAEAAAHQRELEKQRTLHELELDRLEKEDKRTERRHQRFRENASYCVITVLVVGGLIASFLVAVTTSDSTTRTWAQGIVTTLAGGAAGAFFGYLTGKGER